jgi:HAD superfamily hydrolase (TIGR01549 family)
MKDFKAITFDFGGTLVHGSLDKDNYKEALVDYFFRLGFSGGKDRINEARKAMRKRLRKAHEKNRELRFEDLYQGLLFDLELHPTYKRLDYILQLYYSFFRIDFVPGVKEMLINLGGKYKLAIISNVTSNISSFVLKKYDIRQYFDYVVLSRDLGIRKPDPEIFNFTLQNIGVKSYETIHVGDSLEQDIQGAKNVGIKTVWIKGDEGMQNIQPDFMISEVTELPSLFG